MPVFSSEIAIKALDDLATLRAQNEIELRTFAARLSLILRTYLEHSFRFSAREQTRQQIERVLPKVIRNSLPLLAENQSLDMQYAVRSVLHFCERIMFSRNSESAYSIESESVTKRLGETKDLVRQIELYLIKETRRTSTIIGESNLGKTSSAPGTHEQGVANEI